MRAEIHDLLWEQNKDVLYITKARYLEGLKGWTIAPHEVNGERVGATLVCGTEFHFAVFSKNFKLTRADIRRYLLPILEEHGSVTTKTPHEATRQQRFNKLIGFEQTGQDEYYVHFTLKRLLHV